MSKFLAAKYQRQNKKNSILKTEELTNQARAIKLNLFDEDDLPCYPIYEVFNEKFPDFICQICLSFVLDPVECLTCSSIFCRKCLYEYTLYSKHCPNRCDINYRPVNRILKNIICAVKVPCIYFHKGCKEILTFETYDTHLKQCDFNPYMCNQCYLVDVRENIENHCKICNKIKTEKDFMNNNKKRFICKHCNLEIISFDEKQFWYDEYKMNKFFRKFLIHEYLCNEQIVFCSFCDKNFRLYDFMRHNENNICLINQLNNKINYLSHKIDYYESNIKDKKIINDEEEIKNYNSMNHQTKKVDIPYSKRYGVTQSLITNQIKQEEKNEIKKVEKQKNKDKFIKENSLIGQISKNIIKEVNLNDKKFYDKNNEILSILILKDELDKNNNNYFIFSSFKSSFKIERDLINPKNLVNINNSTYDMKEITEKLSQNKHNKINSIAISNLMLTELNNKKDIFITTDSNHYFLFNNELNNLIQWGRPTNSSITCFTEIIMPENNYYIVLGTISSNVQFLDPYSNKIIYTLNHTKKRIISLCYHSYSMTLITSSAKENAFYLWKYCKNKDNFELKSTIKDNNNWIWSITLINLNISSNDKKDYNYIATGGGDKAINIWEFFPEENAVLKKLSIKEHHESVIKLLYTKINNNCIIISGAFDGTIKLHSIKRTFNDEFGEIRLSSKELITIYNKDSEIVNLSYFFCDNNEDNNENDNENGIDLNIIVNLGRSKGYSIHKVKFFFY